MALVVGNAAKAGVRFLSYDKFKAMLADSEVCGFFQSGLSYSSHVIPIG